jgi:hypothetical protein
MKTALIITDITKMRGDRICVAGYLPNKTCIRPVTEGGLNIDILRENGELIIQPFAIVEFDLQSASKYCKPHTEDLLMHSLHRVKCSMLNSSQSEGFLSSIDNINVESIFGAAIYSGPGYYVKEGEGDCSLGTIGSPSIERISHASPSGYRISFKDRCGKNYDLKVTDLTFWKYLDSLIHQARFSPEEAFKILKEKFETAEVYLRIGLARGDWAEFPGRCYLQITGVYSFPDYLEGLSLADFR